MKFLFRCEHETPLCAAGALEALAYGLNRLPSDLPTDPQSAESPLRKYIREVLRPQMSVTDDGIAVIPVSGLLARRPDAFELLYGVEDTLEITSLVDSAARNPQVRGMLLDVDSPGGFYAGGPELGDAVKRAGKPVVAWTGGMMCSLAYWVGSQADLVVASRSAAVGSIGALTVHVDRTEQQRMFGLKVEVFRSKESPAKAPGVFGSTLNEAGRDRIQNRLDADYREFVGTIKGKRPQILEKALQGDVYTGAEAKRLGLIDGVGSLSFAMSMVRSLAHQRDGRR